MSTMLNVQSSVRLDRLRLLADYLEFHVTDDHFSMRTWGNSSDPTASNFCGCAAGHATALFREDGLYLDETLYVPSDRNMPLDPYANSLSALEYFFGIDWFDAVNLFGYDSLSRLEEVQIIREFIAKTETTP